TLEISDSISKENSNIQLMMDNVTNRVDGMLNEVEGENLQSSIFSILDSNTRCLVDYLEACTRYIHSLLRIQLISSVEVDILSVSPELKKEYADLLVILLSQLKLILILHICFVKQFKWRKVVANITAEGIENVRERTAKKVIQESINILTYNHPILKEYQELIILIRKRTIEVVNYFSNQKANTKEKKKDRKKLKIPTTRQTFCHFL